MVYLILEDYPSGKNEVIYCGTEPEKAILAIKEKIGVEMSIDIFEEEI